MPKKFILFLIISIAVGISFAWTIRARLHHNNTVKILPVPPQDREIAWFHTSTSFASWERFVAGIHRAAKRIPELEFDDSRAFLEHSTSTPEVTLSWRDQSSKIRIRWYKVSNDASVRQWLDALSRRDPPPLAIIGGGSSDRARDLARDLNDCTRWQGPRPLLLITTATANDVSFGTDVQSYPLISIYPERSFRFCFTNKQMARAVIDFVWSKQELRPHGAEGDKPGQEHPPLVLPVDWGDDPYSVDLSDKFREATHLYTIPLPFPGLSERPKYSVGSFDRANRSEAHYVQKISSELPTGPGQRALLIIPTSPTPARRFIRALAAGSPLLGRHLVAVTGDSINLDTVYRDGAILWNMSDVPVPLVFFAHNNPISWDDELRPPNGTDEVLLFANLIKAVALSSFRPDQPIVADADELRIALRQQSIVKFDKDGNRADGEEYVVWLRPEISEDGRINSHSLLEVWRRLPGGTWKQKNAEPLRAPYPTAPLRPNPELK